jgi:hypothetical protein
MEKYKIVVDRDSVLELTAESAEILLALNIVEKVTE